MDEIRRNEIAWKMEVWRVKSLDTSSMNRVEIQKAISERAKALSIDEGELAEYVKELAGEAGLKDVV